MQESLHAASFETQADGTVQMRADGSGFDVDAQAAQLATNGLEYEALVAVAKAPHRHPQDRDWSPLMGLFGALDISASGLTAERLRMDVTAENLANAQTTRGADGGPTAARWSCSQQASGSGARPSFGTQLDGAMKRRQGRRRSTRGHDARPPRLRPGHPDADDRRATSTMPNVDPVTEMVDLISASRAYEANVTAMQAAKTIFTKTLELLR